MATTIVRDSGFEPATTVEDGMLAVLRLVLDSSLAEVTGQYFDRFEIAELGRLAELALAEPTAA